MNASRMTDDQISEALRAHVPERAQAGLRDRVVAAAGTTTQERSLPSFLGALSEADPVSRRRSLLIAAALLVALAVASASAVGALRLLQRDPLDELKPPADVPAFVLSSYEQLPQLPPLAMTWQDSDGSDKGRVYIDRSGAVRFDRFTSAEATEPASYTFMSGSRISGMAPVESQDVWVEPGHESFGDDPRVFLRTILGAAEGPGCEMERDPDAAGSGTAATGWRYVGDEYVTGRPTHHVACVGEHALDIDLWLDIETRLILRTRAPLTDDAGQPIPGQFGGREVTQIAFGEQPAALFEPPSGVAHMSSEAYMAYLCTRPVLTDEEVGLGVRDCPSPPEAEASPEPTPTPALTERPDPNDCAVPSPGPSEPTGPLARTQESLEEDWPAPVRPEPAGGASVQPMPPIYIDPSVDTGSDAHACVDIRDLQVGIYEVAINLVSNTPPVVDPTQRWIAYGVVIDTDRDGVPDWRYGIDNLPRTAGDEGGHRRAWRTDLHTGRTERLNGPGYEDVSETYFDSGYPTGESGGHAWFGFGRSADTPNGHVTEGTELDMPLYAWASVIQNGRVVATDYAPDVGWLLPSPGAKRAGTYVVGLATDRHFFGYGFPLRITMSLPEGWTTGGNSVGRFGDNESIGLDFMIIDRAGLDTCGSKGTALTTIGPGVDALVAFLSDQPGIKISESRDATLDGYRGRYLEYETTLNVDNCNHWNPRIWPATTHQHDDPEFNLTWILDVDGVRLVINGFSPKASEEVKAELRQVVESIQIEP